MRHSHFLIKILFRPPDVGREGLKFYALTFNETLRHTLDISQGSVATHLRCGDIFSDGIITNFLLILIVNNFENRLIFGVI